MLYFAYGSNMNLEQMTFRCPDATPLGPATLSGYRLTERRFADIDPAPGHEVHGLLWRVTAADLRALDRYEGFPRFYSRHLVKVRLDLSMLDAIVYEMTPQAKRERSGESYSREYRRICSAGAQAAGIVNAYQENAQS